MPTRSVRRLSLAFPLAIVGALFGCAAPLSVSAMVPHDVEIAHRLPGSVTVRAEGSERSIFGRAVISGESLHAAIVQALTQHELFDGVRAKDADWELIVSVAKLDEPETGLDMSATVELDWLLMRRGTGDIAWNEAVRTSHTATTYDETFMEERRAAALQGAVQKNIERGLARISQLSAGADAASRP